MCPGIIKISSLDDTVHQAWVRIFCYSVEEIEASGVL